MGKLTQSVTWLIWFKFFTNHFDWIKSTYRYVHLKWNSHRNKKLHSILFDNLYKTAPTKRTIRHSFYNQLYLFKYSAWELYKLWPETVIIYESMTIFMHKVVLNIIQLLCKYWQNILTVYGGTLGVSREWYPMVSQNQTYKTWRAFWELRASPSTHPSSFITAAPVSSQLVSIPRTNFSFLTDVLNMQDSGEAFLLAWLGRWSVMKDVTKGFTTIHLWIVGRICKDVSILWKEKKCIMHSTCTYSTSCLLI